MMRGLTLLALLFSAAVPTPYAQEAQEEIEVDMGLSTLTSEIQQRLEAKEKAEQERIKKEQEAAATEVSLSEQEEAKQALDAADYPFNVNGFFKAVRQQDTEAIEKEIVKK